jgi:hypothetical protein
MAAQRFITLCTVIVSTFARKYIKIIFFTKWPPTWFSQPCGNLQGGKIQRMYMLRSNSENAQWAEKKTRTRCGNSETATTRNLALWTFCNSHNAFWHVKNCHEAKFASWLLEKTTTTCSGNIELLERDVVVSFYSHDTMWGKYEGFFFSFLLLAIRSTTIDL